LGKEIQNKGLVAPRVTDAMIEEVIKQVTFHVFPETQLTVCCLTLQNGFTVTGESACVSPENFDSQIGQDISYKKAREKIWALEGYALAERLYWAEHNKL
jgi:hypothetical protein